MATKANISLQSVIDAIKAKENIDEGTRANWITEVNLHWNEEVYAYPDGLIAFIDSLPADAPVSPAAKPICKAISLSDERQVLIRKGKGRDAIAAQRNSDGNAENYQMELMAQLVTIDGVPVVREDLEEMDMGDFLAIQGEFASLNFM
jgi:hypothetical protein